MPQTIDVTNKTQDAINTDNWCNKQDEEQDWKQEEYWKVFDAVATCFVELPTELALEEMQ